MMYMKQNHPHNPHLMNAKVLDEEPHQVSESRP